METQTVDLGVFIIANVINILLIGIFLSRPRGQKKAEHVLGLIVVAMILPVGAAIILNILEKREWWAIILPLILILFLTVELLLDYILKLNFRKTRWLWPYLLLYYSAMMAMIGYSFSMGNSYGFVTLGTYFLGLLATWYSYAKVGHGQ
jgi:cytochrome c biogenesis protein CcdA